MASLASLASLASFHTFPFNNINLLETFLFLSRCFLFFRIELLRLFSPSPSAMNEEIYCALCGVPFDVWADLYRNGSVKGEDVEWTKYFIARKSMRGWFGFIIANLGAAVVRKAEATGAAGKVVWFLSGVGETDNFTSFEDLFPPLDYDARSQKLGENDAADPSSFFSASAYCKR